jgi:hypothetical protein
MALWISVPLRSADALPATIETHPSTPARGTTRTSGESTSAGSSWLVVGLLARERVRDWLRRLVARYSSGTIRRSLPIAILLMASAVIVATIPFWLA